MADVRQEARSLDDDAIREVLSTRLGRRFVRMVLGHLEWNEEVFASDPIVLAGRVGRQVAGVRLYRALEDRQPELLARVFAEERERQALVTQRGER